MLVLARLVFLIVLFINQERRLVWLRRLGRRNANWQHGLWRRGFGRSREDDGTGAGEEKGEEEDSQGEKKKTAKDRESTEDTRPIYTENNS